MAGCQLMSKNFKKLFSILQEEEGRELEVDDLGIWKRMNMMKVVDREKVTSG